MLKGINEEHEKEPFRTVWKKFFVGETATIAVKYRLHQTTKYWIVPNNEALLTLANE